jgi:hypothetical protein
LAPSSGRPAPDGPEPVSPQARLDRIVVLIAANVVAEVCSVYVLRDDNTAAGIGSSFQRW